MTKIREVTAKLDAGQAADVYGRRAMTWEDALRLDREHGGSSANRVRHRAATETLIRVAVTSNSRTERRHQTSTETLMTSRAHENTSYQPPTTARQHNP
jgi:hypothetical protein